MRGSRRAAVTMFVLGVVRDLAIGCAMTVLVAWCAMAILGPVDWSSNGTTIRESRPDLEVRTVEWRGFARVTFSARMEDLRKHPDFPDVRRIAIVDGIKAGWPMLALCGERDPPRYNFANAVQVDVPRRAHSALIRLPGMRNRSELPLTPIWPGFAVDALVSACVVRAAFVGIGWWRGRRRNRRGLCRRCGHQLDIATTCPECGHAVPIGTSTTPGEVVKTAPNP